MFEDLLFLLPFILLYPAERGDDNDRQAYISRQTGNHVRGIAALTVVIHHLSQRTGSGILRYFFWFAGVYPVSVFLFYSGYGLMKRYREIPGYDKGFLKRRLLPVLLPYCLMHPLYYLISVFSGAPYTLQDFIRGIVTGDPVVLFSWYSILIICWYLYFAFLMKVCRGSEGKMLAGGILFVVVWCLSCRMLSWGIWWYNTAHILPAGMFWCVYEEKILEWLSPRRKRIILVSAAVFALTYAVPYLFAWQYPLFFISTCSFTVLMNLLLMRRRPANKAADFLGNISYGLYLLHGALITLLRGNRIYIQSDFPFCVCVLGGGVLAAWFCHYLMRIIRAGK